MSDSTVMRRFRGYLCRCTSMVALDDTTPGLCPTHGAGGVRPEEITPADADMPLGLVHHPVTRLPRDAPDGPLPAGQPGRTGRRRPERPRHARHGPRPRPQQCPQDARRLGRRARLHRTNQPAHPRRERVGAMPDQTTDSGRHIPGDPHRYLATGGEDNTIDIVTADDIRRTLVMARHYSDGYKPWAHLARLETGDDGAHLEPVRLDYGDPTTDDQAMTHTPVRLVAASDSGDWFDEFLVSTDGLS